MKYKFLIPPSEGKKSGNNFDKEKLTFEFKKPLDIAIYASEKDLKCKGDRYKEGFELNKNILKSKTDFAISVYTGSMYNAIDYDNLNLSAKNFFNKNFFIFSGMYGILSPQDLISSYKLPIETKGLYDFWGEKIIQSLVLQESNYFVNLLPNSYAKLIGIGKSAKLKKIRDIFEKHNKKIININFLKQDGKKLSHGVKTVKGDFIKDICQKGNFDYKYFEFSENKNMIDIIIKTGL